jgi:hypothetical protein
VWFKITPFILLASAAVLRLEDDQRSRRTECCDAESQYQKDNEEGRIYLQTGVQDHRGRETAFKTRAIFISQFGLDDVKARMALALTSSLFMLTLQAHQGIPKSDRTKTDDDAFVLKVKVRRKVGIARSGAVFSLCLIEITHAKHVTVTAKTVCVAQGESSQHMQLQPIKLDGAAVPSISRALAFGPWDEKSLSLIQRSEDIIARHNSRTMARARLRRCRNQPL